MNGIPAESQYPRLPYIMFVAESNSLKDWHTVVSKVKLNWRFFSAYFIPLEAQVPIGFVYLRYHQVKGA